MCGSKRKLNQQEQSEPAVESIRPSKVPKLFHSGAFYHSLDKEDDAAIQIPINVTRSNQILRTNKELTLLLSSLRFWGVAEIPDKVVAKLVLRHKFNLMKAVVNKFKMCFPMLETVWTLQQFHPQEAMEKALRARNLEMVRILGSNRAKFPPNACNLLAEFGNRECLQLAHNSGIVVTLEDCCVAGRAKNMETLQYMHEVNCPCDVSVLRAIAMGGDNDCFQYALNNNFAGFEKLYACVLLRFGVDMVRAAHQRGASLWGLMFYAAGANSLACMQYAQEQGQEWYPEVVYSAAQNTSTECLRYAIDHGCPYDPMVLVQYKATL